MPAKSANVDVPKENKFCFAREDAEEFYACMAMKKYFEDLDREEAQPELTFFQTDIGQVSLIVLGFVAGYGIGRIVTK